MSDLYMPHKQFEITPPDNYQYQWGLIRSTQKKKYTIKNANIETKNPKDSTSKNNAGQNLLKKKPSKTSLDIWLIDNFNRKKI